MEKYLKASILIPMGATDQLRMFSLPRALGGMVIAGQTNNVHDELLLTLDTT